MLHMTYRRARLFVSLAGLALVSPIGAVPASAQIPGAPAGTGGIATGQRHGGPAAPPRQKEPAALPGAQTKPGSAAPFVKPPSEMGPTEALFDAVNRGDVAAAREAVSRGADMNEHNLLGLTALELSVDLGHNDIAFLLLSLKGTQAPKGSAKSAPAATPATKVVKRPAAVAAPASAMAGAAATRSATPRQFANDGGAPIPAAGFLGFGAGH